MKFAVLFCITLAVLFMVQHVVGPFTAQALAFFLLWSTVVLHQNAMDAEIKRLGEQIDQLTAGRKS